MTTARSTVLAADEMFRENPKVLATLRADAFKSFAKLAEASGYSTVRMSLMPVETMESDLPAGYTSDYLGEHKLTAFTWTADIA